MLKDKIEIRTGSHTSVVAKLNLQAARVDIAGAGPLTLAQTMALGAFLTAAAEELKAQAKDGEAMRLSEKAR